MSLMLKDLAPCVSNWSFQDQSTYAKLDYYLAKSATKQIPYHQTFAKFFGTWNWTPKQGNVVKHVRKERPPVNRSTFYPAQRTAAAKRDIIDISESSEQSRLYHHKIESPFLYYDADFAAFLDNHKEVGKAINAQMAIYPELFVRSAIWDMSPYAYVCGYGFVDLLHVLDGVFAGTVKTAGTLADLANKCTKRLTLQELDRACQAAVDERNFVPYQGGSSPSMKGTIDSLLTDKFILVGERQFASQVKYDNLTAEFKDQNMNLLTAGFKGTIFDDVVVRAERYPWRWKVAADGSVTFPDPEVREVGAVARLGQAVTDTDYRTAQITVYWIIGAEPYKMIKPGPPPSAFTGSMKREEFQGMDWNGKVRETNNVLIPCPELAGTSGSLQQAFDTNKYGDVTQFIGQITMGIQPVQRYNMFPIIALRPAIAIPA